MRITTGRVVLAALAVCSGSLSAAPAASQQVQLQQPARYGPDLLNTSGVGARAIGMGSAYSIIGDDVSSTFWNPARLGRISERKQFEIEMRSVFKGSLKVTDNGVFGGAVSESGRSTVGDPQLSFIGVAVPLTGDLFAKVKGQTQKKSFNYGTIAASFSLGGYANLDLTNSLTNALNQTVTNKVHTVVRNSIFTFAYGREDAMRKKSDPDHPSGIISSGVGVYVLSQDQNQKTGTQTFDPANQSTVVNAAGGYHDVGRGVGFIVGATYQPLFPSKDKKTTGGNIQFGVTYRSGATIDGLDPATGGGFNKEVPDRLTLGTAYVAPANKGKDQVTLAAEVQRFGSANAGLNDARREVLNTHVGMEWVPGYHSDTQKILVPVRLGFHTLANADRALFSYDNAVTFGFGVQTLYSDRKPHLSVETALEYLLHSSQVQYTVSGHIRF